MALGIIVCGVGGRMGGAVVRAIQQSSDFKLAAAIDKPGSARLGKDAGEIAGAGRLDVPVTDKFDAAPKPNTVIIDVFPFMLSSSKHSESFLAREGRSRSSLV